MSARVVLHEIGRPYFKYPTLEESWWYLPTVNRWQPWEPVIAPPRASRGLVGKLIVPGLVDFKIPPHVYLDRRKVHNEFKMHLQQRTGSYWNVDDIPITDGYIRAERLDSSVRYTEPDGHTTHTLALPGSPTRSKRRTLVGSLVRGIFLDEYSRRDEDDDGTTGHTPRNGA